MNRVLRRTSILVIASVIASLMMTGCASSSAPPDVVRETLSPLDVVPVSWSVGVLSIGDFSGPEFYIGSAGIKDDLVYLYATSNGDSNYPDSETLQAWAQVTMRVICSDRSYSLKLSDLYGLQPLQNVQLLGESKWAGWLVFSLGDDVSMLPTCAFTYDPINKDNDPDFYQTSNFIHPLGEVVGLLIGATPDAQPGR